MRIIHIFSGLLLVLLSPILLLLWMFGSKRPPVRRNYMPSHQAMQERARQLGNRELRDKV